MPNDLSWERVTSIGNGLHPVPISSPTPTRQPFSWQYPFSAFLCFVDKPFLPCHRSLVCWLGQLCKLGQNTTRVTGWRLTPQGPATGKFRFINIKLQQQLVGVARAVITEPQLLLADEPTGNLHSAQGEEIMDLFTRLNSQGTTIVQVTHSERNAGYGNRIIYLRDGWIVDS